MFGFNSAKSVLNFLKCYLLIIVSNKRDIKPTVNGKAIPFIIYKFGDNQLLDLMKFLEGALITFLEAYETPETRSFFPNKSCDRLDKLQNKRLSPV